MTSIAVSGATGRLGGRVARRLAAAGVQQRLIVRDLGRAPRLEGAGIAGAEYGDGPALRRAMQGIDTVLMVSASEAADRSALQRTFIDAATAAGVRHLVYVSFYGASPTATFTLARDHWAAERHVRASGMAFTFLRDNLYADFLPAMVGDDGVIRGPAGQGRVAVVAQDDIAEVAVAVLCSPADHAGATYDMTGPEARTFDEIAAALTAATGRTVSYRPETVAEAYASRARYGVPRWRLDAWVSTYTAIAAGEMAGVSDAVPAITGHPATSLEDVLAAGR